MNKEMVVALDALDESMNRALIACSKKMMIACNDVDESFEGMACMIDIISTQHCQTIWALVGSTLKMNEDGLMSVPNSALKETVDECVSEFQKALATGIKKSCEDFGYPNILDPNEKVREEILNGNL